MDFGAVTGFQKPDFRTINLFRKRHLTALGGLFQQVLRLCRKSGLASLGHVALDGTKIKANASKHKAMSYDRMEKADGEFAEIVKEWLDQAEITDLAEDARFRNKQGDELPAWVSNKVERMKKIREAKAALEKEAAEKAEAERKTKGKDDDEDPPGEAQARSQGPAELYGPRKPDHAHAKRWIRAVLQRPGGGGCGRPGDRGLRCGGDQCGHGSVATDGRANA